MAHRTRTGITAAIQSVLTDGPDFLRVLIERVVQAVVEAEMTAPLHAEPYEHSPERRGYRKRYKPRQLPVLRIAACRWQSKHRPRLIGGS